MTTNERRCDLCHKPAPDPDLFFRFEVRLSDTSRMTLTRPLCEECWKQLNKR